ncbi:MAG: hypothetical protein GXO48_08110 [Chlorobi bacterium]|nr:hypothetical protein [Chlorobiota bacterium]
MKGKMAMITAGLIMGAIVLNSCKSPEERTAKKLKGDWKVTSWEFNGQEVLTLTDEYFDDLCGQTTEKEYFSVTEGKFSFRDNGELKVNITTKYEWEFISQDCGQDYETATDNINEKMEWTVIDKDKVVLQWKNSQNFDDTKKYECTINELKKDKLILECGDFIEVKYELDLLAPSQSVSYTITFKKS